MRSQFFIHLYHKYTKPNSTGFSSPGGPEFIEDLFYSCGWQDFWDAADIDVDDEDAVNADEDFESDDLNRQQAWGVLKSHKVMDPHAC